jgi:excisionase family DNA binding protein
MELLLSPEQAAAKLHVHPATVRLWLRAGLLRGVKRRRIWRVPESALHEAPSNKSGNVSGSLAFEPDDSADEHNRKIRELARAPREVQEAALKAAANVAARYYESDEGRAELTDWRALDGEDFHDAD